MLTLSADENARDDKSKSLRTQCDETRMLCIPVRQKSKGSRVCRALWGCRCFDRDGRFIEARNVESVANHKAAKRIVGGAPETQTNVCHMS